NGFVLDKHTADSLANPRVIGLLGKFPDTAAIWLPGGKPHPEGTVIKLPALAEVLVRIRDKGPDGLYKRATAKAIADAMKANGGTITPADLAGYKAEGREPLRFTYRGKSIASMPLPSSGGLVLAMTAGMLREKDLSKLEWHGT